MKWCPPVCLSSCTCILTCIAFQQVGSTNNSQAMSYDGDRIFFSVSLHTPQKLI